LAESLGSTLKKLRERQGLSKNKLAELSGIDRSHIFNIEKGKQKSITLTTARKLAAPLKVSPSVFMQDEQFPALPIRICIQFFQLSLASLVWD
jgi:transcriptional regulator with XRE-family HTH domain